MVRILDGWWAGVRASKVLCYQRSVFHAPPGREWETVVH